MIYKPHTIKRGDFCTKMREVGDMSRSELRTYWCDLHEDTETKREAMDITKDMTRGELISGIMVSWIDDQLNQTWEYLE